MNINVVVLSTLIIISCSQLHPKPGNYYDGVIYDYPKLGNYYDGVIYDYDVKKTNPLGHGEYGSYGVHEHGYYGDYEDENVNDEPFIPAGFQKGQPNQIDSFGRCIEWNEETKQVQLCTGLKCNTLTKEECKEDEMCSWEGYICIKAKLRYCRHPDKNFNSLHRDGESFYHCCHKCFCECFFGECRTTCHKSGCPCGSCGKGECDAYFFARCFWNDMFSCIKGNKDENCITKQTGTSCIFPFIYKDKTYNGCTSVDADKSWCATSVDGNGKYVKDNWGYCSSGCKMPSEDENCITKQTGASCIFPFIYKDKTFNGCTSVDADKPWCATSVDGNGKYVKDNWGYCSSGCKMPNEAPKCGIEKADGRISGGTGTSPNKYPWMVRLPMGCGGSLISDRHVLTAKHCVKGKQLRGSKAKVSVHNQYDPNDYEEVPIKDSVWPTTSNHDIAIIILDRPVDLSDETIGTVCLPSNANKDYRGKKAMAMGWGWFPDTSSQSKFLQHLELTVAQREAENWLWTETRLINGVPLDVCRGDSGGPLVHKEAGQWTVIATVSGGDICDHHTGNDGLWNKVTDHLEWIKSILEN